MRFLIKIANAYSIRRDVTYIFAQNGNYFLVVAIERGSRVRVKIPREALGVRGLLAAIEDGLILQPQKSAFIATIFANDNQLRAA